MEPLAHIRAVAERVAASRGLDVWDIQSRREAVGHVVRVFIDRPGPSASPEESVSIEDCEQVNREIGAILDVEDPLPFAYTLEVSSPGLDRPFSIEDCEQVNREIGAILDVEDPLPFAYTLEVSSPGLDRPLRDADDYSRFAGRLAKVVVSEAVDNQKAFEGRLRGIDQGNVLLEASNGRLHRLPWRLIARGRLDVEF